MTYKEIKDLVYDYPTKHPQGFTQSEIEALLVTLNINQETFKEKFGINTCMLIEGEVIKYHTDIHTTIRCCIENRSKTFTEWD